MHNHRPRPVPPSEAEAQAKLKAKKKLEFVESEKTEKNTKGKGKDESGGNEKADSGSENSANEVENVSEGNSGEEEGKAEGKEEGKSASEHDDGRVVSAPPKQPLPSRESLLRVRDRSASSSSLTLHPRSFTLARTLQPDLDSPSPARCNLTLTHPCPHAAT